MENKVEPHVICTKCNSRIRANTYNNIMFCDCGRLRVIGNSKHFKTNKSCIVVMENISKYQLSKDSLSELW